MEFIRHGLRAKKEKWKSSTETAGTRWDAAVSWETAAIWSLAKRRHDHFSRPPKGSTYIDRWIFWSQHDVYDITIYDWYWLVVRPNIYHHLSSFINISGLWVVAIDPGRSTVWEPSYISFLGDSAKPRVPNLQLIIGFQWFPALGQSPWIFSAFPMFFFPSIFVKTGPRQELSSTLAPTACRLWPRCWGKAFRCHGLPFRF